MRANTVTGGNATGVAGVLAPAAKTWLGVEINSTAVTGLSLSSEDVWGFEFHKFHQLAPPLSHVGVCASGAAQGLIN